MQVPSSHRTILISYIGEDHIILQTCAYTENNDSESCAGNPPGAGQVTCRKIDQVSQREVVEPKVPQQPQHHQ